MKSCSDPHRRRILLPRRPRRGAQGRARRCAPVASRSSSSSTRRRCRGRGLARRRRRHELPPSRHDSGVRIARRARRHACAGATASCSTALAVVVPARRRPRLRALPGVRDVDAERTLSTARVEQTAAAIGAPQLWGPGARTSGTVSRSRSSTTASTRPTPISTRPATRCRPASRRGRPRSRPRK